MTQQQLIAFILNSLPDNKRNTLPSRLAKYEKEHGFEQLSNFIDASVLKMAESLSKKITAKEG